MLINAQYELFFIGSPLTTQGKIQFRANIGVFFAAILFSNFKIWDPRVCPPVPPQISESSDVTVEEEAQVLLSCHMWANPQVADVSWTLNGSSVDLEDSGLTLTVDGLYSQLSTDKAERGRHEGTYQCSTVYFSKVYTKTFKVKLTGQSSVLLKLFQERPCVKLIVPTVSICR